MRYLPACFTLTSSFSVRNVYAVFNFGDFVAGGNDTTNRGDPYLQFLSTTDPTEGMSRSLFSLPLKSNGTQRIPISSLFA